MLKQLFISIFFVFIYFSELSACKIWAIISKQDRSLNIQSQDELFLVNEQLGVYYNQSQHNANGWSVLQYPLSQTADGINVYRSALPANYDSLNYWNEMLSIFNDFNSKIAIAHLRAATSGASDIPNPHPWIFEGEKTFSFVHNGGASKDLLYDIITEDGITMPFEGMKSALSNPKHINFVPTIAGSNRDEVKLWIGTAEYFVKLDYSFIGSILGVPRVTLKDEDAFEAFNYYRSEAWRLRGVVEPISYLNKIGNHNTYAYKFESDIICRILCDLIVEQDAFLAREHKDIWHNDATAYAYS